MNTEVSDEDDALRLQKLLQHVEERMLGCLAHRCSASVLRDIREAQGHMIGTTSHSVVSSSVSNRRCDASSVLCPVSADSVRPLLSQGVQEQLSSPSSSFDLTYDLGLAALCADFRENIEFQFSLGWSALVTRFIGAANAKRALRGSEPRRQVLTGRSSTT